MNLKLKQHSIYHYILVDNFAVYCTSSILDAKQRFKEYRKKYRLWAFKHKLKTLLKHTT